MNAIEVHSVPAGRAIVPAFRDDVQARLATLDDLPFIDQLQAKHSKQLGYMPRKQLEGKIEAGLAFRAGSEKKGRVHIFWQKRIRPDDTTTPWWFPAKTDSGSIRQDRLVLPIPPQLHWRDPMPVLHPEAQENQEPRHGVPQADAPLLAPSARRHGRAAARADEVEPAEPTRRARPYILAGPPPADPAPGQPPPQVVTVGAKPSGPRRKADPKLIAAARELRDRWLEKITREPSLLAPAGKYDLARQLPDEHQALPDVEVKALPEAA